MNFKIKKEVKLYTSGDWQPTFQKGEFIDDGGKKHTEVYRFHYTKPNGNLTTRGQAVLTREEIEQLLTLAKKEKWY